MTTQPATSEISGTDAAGEPCPTPLAWQQVVQAFRSEREEFTFDLAGRKLHGAAFGTGSPLYFLGGSAGSWDLFALSAWLLREEYCCNFVELPPLGYFSSASDGLDLLSNAVIAAADSRGDETFSLFAASFGGLVALQAMLSHADRIDSAVLVCSAARRKLTLVERGLIAWGGLLPGRLCRLPGWKRIQEQNHRAWFPPYDASRWEFLLSNLGETPIAAASRRSAVLGGIDLRPRLPEIAQPVLLVRTEGEGRILAEYQRELQAGLPNARSEEMHSSGQLPYLTHPHRVAKLVRAFVGGSG